MLVGGARLALSSPAKTVRIAVVGWPEGIVEQAEVMRIFDPNLSDADHERLRQAFLHVQDWFLESSRRQSRTGYVFNKILFDWLRTCYAKT